MNLLVIDPDPQTAAQGQRVLAEQVIVAEHGVVAIESAQSGTDAWMILRNFRHPLDVVLLELDLPDIDGIALLTRIRQSSAHRDISVVICSAKLHRAVVAKIIALGVRHFIVKPATDELLRAKLGEVMAARTEASRR